MREHRRLLSKSGIFRFGGIPFVQECFDGVEKETEFRGAAKAYYHGEARDENAYNAPKEEAYDSLERNEATDPPSEKTGQNDNELVGKISQEVAPWRLL